MATGDPVRGAGWGGLLRGVGDGRKESEPLVGATFCLNMHLDLTDVIITTSSTSIESENCHWNLPVGLEELIVDGCMVGAGKVLPRVCLRRCGLSRSVAPHNAHYLVIRLWSCLN